MKKKQVILWLMFVQVFLILGMNGCGRKELTLLSNNEIKVLIIHHPSLSKKQPAIVQAYEKVLEEEGVPFQFVTLKEILYLDLSALVQVYPAIIIPDGIAQILPIDFANRLKSYVNKGGNLLLVYDGGIKNVSSRYLNRSVFAEFLGINYIPYRNLKGRTYTRGFIKFKDYKSLDFFQIPKGRIDKNFIISGYQYGNLEYPIARVEILPDFKEEDVFAFAITTDGEKYPAIVFKKYGEGNLLYTNLPLGYLKGYVEDLPLRAVLRTFLFKVSKIPHLVNTPSGKGGLVINWHVDANLDWEGIPFMEKNKLLRRNIQYSIHITAGDSCYQPGDGCGFDALGKGRPLVENLARYGIIGSHGGWFHDWFANNLRTGKFGPQEEEEYIKKNKDALESIVGYKIIEYSAPAGVHPQPVTTHILEKLGFVSYYYTGDAGSSPNRTFVKGKMVSDKVIAFPIIPFGKEGVSLYELKIANIPSEKVEEWLCEIVDYVIKNRSIRLFYSHPYNAVEYPKALSSFIDYAEKKASKGELNIKPMSYFARFLIRFLKTQYVLRLKNDGIELKIKNPEGLNEITVAIPKNHYKCSQISEFLLDEDMDYYYLTYKGNATEKTLYFSNFKK